ncbi:hypothetical protein FG381_05175 [Sutterella faecalis]|uniref:Uncharacterized protein n=3 Tax=Sutterellaceae TaxID=995019 RepID=A0AAI9WP72_9BURK|nr:hypothetical protein GBM96_00635 [Sutterella seckii]QDA55735.1 hypothetical protein FG381_05175 [Sutterella faecalis]
MFMLYNFMSAFVACLVVVLLGEWLSKLTKGWIPSVFISAVILLLCFWTFLPKTVVADAKILQLGSTVAIFLLIAHMGTLFSLKRLLEQWKTVIICLAGLLGMCSLAWFVCPLLMDKTLVITGLPPLAGGIVATTMMQKAAQDAGLPVAAVFAISMYCIQGFAGYPLTAICLKREAQKLLKEAREGHPEGGAVVDSRRVMAEAMALPENEKRGILAVPESWNTPFFVLLKLALVGWLALVIGILTGVSGAIWALVLGVIFCRLGFLEPDVLSKTGSKDLLFFALIMFVYSGLADCTPALLFDLIGPMLILLVIGLCGMGIMAFIVGRILKISPWLGYANCLTALYGFPFDAIMTEKICHDEGANKEEVDYLMSRLFPSMIVGGFVTVTITSVVLAGIFVKFL